MAITDPVLRNAIEELAAECEHLAVEAGERHQDTLRLKDLEQRWKRADKEQQTYLLKIPEGGRKAKARQEFDSNHINPIRQEWQEVRNRCDSTALQTREVTSRLKNISGSLADHPSAKQLTNVLNTPYFRENIEFTRPEGWLNAKASFGRASRALLKIHRRGKISQTRRKVRTPLSALIAECKGKGLDFRQTASALSDCSEFANDPFIARLGEKAGDTSLDWMRAARHPKTKHDFRKKFDKVKGSPL